MTKNLNSREMLTNNSVKIRYNPGRTIAELYDYVKPAVRQKAVMLSFTQVQMIMERTSTQ